MVLPQSLQARYPAPVAVLPGLALTGAVAAAAMAIPPRVGAAALSPLILALLFGVGLRRVVGRPDAAGPGIQLAMRPLLRLAIVLLGFRITLTEVAALGPRGLVAVTATLAGAFVVTRLAGRVLGVDRRLSELIAAGTAVCGASAVIACNTVTRGSDEDVAYALACVTLFGTLAMLGLPLLAGPLGLAAETYGLWAGATIHEVAQVVGAAFARGEAAGHAGTVAKLARVALLAPLILVLGLWGGRGGGGAGAVPIPWFVLGFLAAMGVNTVVDLPAAVTGPLSAATAFLLTLALAAMGLETDLGKLRRKGLRPLLLGAVGWLFIAGAGLLLAVWATSGAP